MLKCIIIDDEQFSIDTLTKYIRMMPELEITATFTNPQQALTGLLSAPKIDILFMNINVQELLGLEPAKALFAKTEKLILSTSHSIYTLSSFEVTADAYLLKPFTFLKFSNTISHLFACGQNLADSINNTGESPSAMVEGN